MPTRDRPHVRRVDRDLRAIGAVTQAVLDGEQIDALLGRVAEEARSLVDARLGIVSTIAGQTVTVRAVAGTTAGPLVGQTLPAEGSLTAEVLRLGETIAARSPGEMPVRTKRLLESNDIVALVAVPLGQPGTARGVLLVGNVAGAPPFRAADITLIETFAAQAASALELSDLRADEARLALDLERRRIARDLHDGVVQALFGLGIGLRGLADRTIDGGIVSGLVDAIGRIDDTIGVVREFIAGLGSSLPDQGDALELTDVGSTGATRAMDAKTTSSAAADPGHEPMPTDQIAAIGRLAQMSTAMGTGNRALAALLEGASAAADGFGLVGTLTADGRHVRVRARTGPDVAGRRVGDVHLVDETLVGRAIDLGRPVILQSPDEPAPWVPEPVRRMLGPIVTVPLVIRGRAFGALSIARDRGARPYTTTEISLVQAYAVQAAIALEFDRVREELRLGTVAAERERIGRDLHEQVIQVLFGVGLSLQAMETRTHDEPTRATLREAVDDLDRAIRDLRRYVFGLGPSLIVGRRFDEEVAALARELVSPAIELDLVIDRHASALLGDAAPEVIQVVREALSNVARHSGARRCRVLVGEVGDRVIVEVSDDGAGRASSAAGSGHGLLNMRARAADLGAEFEIRGPGASGTAIHLVIPISEAVSLH